MLPNNKPYIIGETAFHHEGDKAFLIELISEIKKVGVHAIKFHFILDIDDYMIQNHEAIDVIRPWCFDKKQWDEILSETSGIDIVALCNDVDSIKYAVASDANIVAIELHATGLNDIFLLEEASKFNKTIILGTGGSTLDEIDFAVNYLKSKGHEDIFLMHGFQNYPTDFNDIKLDRMIKLKSLFELPVGYADHTDPESKYNEYISCMGLAKGFNVIEKHITHQFGKKRIDSQAAVSLDQMKNIIELAHVVFKSNGSESCLELTEAEKKYGNTGPMKKAIVAREEISLGSKISIENIAYKRTNKSSSIKQNELSKLLNNIAARDIKKDEIIDFSNVVFEFKTQDVSQFYNTEK